MVSMRQRSQMLFWPFSHAVPCPLLFDGGQQECLVIEANKPLSLLALIRK
jgi:hypothetical protein